VGMLVASGVTAGIGVFVGLGGGVRVTVGCGVAVGDAEVQPIKNEISRAATTLALAIVDNFIPLPPIARLVRSLGVHADATIYKHYLHFCQ
jgi:hypothetical protein